MRRKSAREVVEAAAVTHATVVESLKLQRDTYQVRLVDRIEEVENLTARLAEAERHREVLADALRGVLDPRTYGEWWVTPAYDKAAEVARTALDECGLLRAQDDPAMIPAAWLPGAEEEEG